MLKAVETIAFNSNWHFPLHKRGNNILRKAKTDKTKQKLCSKFSKSFIKQDEWCFVLEVKLHASKWIVWKFTRLKTIATASFHEFSLQICVEWKFTIFSSPRKDTNFEEFHFYYFYTILSRPNQLMKIDDRKSNQSIDINRWQLVNCYRLVSANRWPIDNHNLKPSNCYWLPSIFYLLLLDVLIIPGRSLHFARS